MKVKIYKPAKSTMQSGVAKNKWIIEILEESNPRKVNELMGWVSVDNTNSQLKFEFSSKEEAVDFAKKSGFEYILEEPKIKTLKKKSYSDNFC